MTSRFQTLGMGAAPHRADRARPGGEVSAMEPGVSPVEPEDEDFWAPFLAYRPGDRRAERLKAHAREDARRGQRHPPRRAAALSRDEIVRTAIAVADAEGAEAVNMRRIARELGSGTMSLYWHVASKDELLDMMIDAIIGEAQAPEPSGDWRADLRAGACTTRDALHRHQWAVNFMSTRPPAGPKMLRNLERSLGALDGLGLDKATALTILMAVSTYVLGAVLREQQEANSERYMAELFEDLPEAEKQAVIRDFTERIRTSGHFPRMVAMLDEGVDPDAADTRDERFEFGLDCLLDGIASRLPAHTPRTH
ncbi:MAG TPA: TetR/AcrR family transcriptional regulator [Streptosporangiaceae bacterium]|nr:TetR/AcrR family transcriptional regulator [Streptosporangiaceae bacterium]